MNHTVLRKFNYTFAIVLALMGTREACAQTGPGVTPQGAFIYQRAENQNGGVPYNTGNGQFADDGIGHAVALYTGNDGMVSGSIKSGFTGAEDVEASVQWFFTVLAPLDRTQLPVPIIMSGLGRLTVQGATPGNMVATGAHFSGPFGTVGADLEGNGDIPFVISSSGAVHPYQSYSIQLGIAENVFAGFYDNYNFGGTTVSVNAMIDPIVEFAPYFDSDGYTIVSSDVPPFSTQSPPAQVPEPPTSTIVVIGGMGMLAVARSRSGTLKDFGRRHGDVFATRKSLSASRPFHRAVELS